MLQDKKSLTVTMPSAIQEDFVETLSLNPLTGEFTFGSLTQPITGAFRISLANPQRIIINTDPGIQFALPTSTSDSAPIGFLSLNNSGAVTVASVSATHIELDVTALPSTSGVLGFFLFTKLTGGSPIIQDIESPPFFITRNQPFTAPEFNLNYVPSTGIFHIAATGGSEIPPLLKVERGAILLRLSAGGSNDMDVREITVTLNEEAQSAGITFAETPLRSTVPHGSTSPTVTSNSNNTAITITRDFTPGTGFGVSFGVKVPQPGREMFTVFSPDPVIIDKQIGGGT